MNTNNQTNEIVDDDGQQRFCQLRTEWFHQTPHSSVPHFYEQTVTTTTTTSINKEANSTTDEMTTVHLEKSPIRRVNLVTGPQSAYARLFPDKYRREQEDITRKQGSKWSDCQRYNFDRIQNQQISFSNDDKNEQLRQKSHQVSFDDQQCDEYLSNQNSRPKFDSYCAENLARIPLNYDPDPEIVYRDNPDKFVYIQKIGVRYLKPPTPPPPEPIIVREVRATPPQDPPPLYISSTPPVTPRTPSPWIVREQPPTPPRHQPATIITKTLPPPPIPPRRVIIKRVPPLPAKPRPVIIEKWLPYKTPPERPIIYERVPQPEQTHRTQRNLILQYEPAHVRVEQDVQNVGCFRVDPQIYRAKFGSSLRRTDSIQKVLQDIGCDPNLLVSTGYQPQYASVQDNYISSSSSSHYDYPKSTTKTCFTDEQLATLLGTKINTNHHYDVPSTSTHQNQVHYTSVISSS
ncbi:unnamed protein product [Rotaria socialis]|uniref:Uncharacterized protein n=1 Tax=Rotaria socialis TaxID=392032 RepID=A0A821KMC3_9BILA|nr:unnamed protein product [Rotaria socialis]CAF3461830.1 unnamed protein product [Rotaria socialis]CAF3603815.1 unnamed protein product [Rotaria socialis]CAF4361517.1 unnamed protein product [Rotaria socialis]CAF4428674.1 unnamed protein product [Rotaria socialis]